ncbi:MAG: hypothetical protein A4E63_02616 [Syntrophorhabdus sp. PtaU1.Bin050]|nr:MAG: hypothetical protein A4E63_02616 [Syntrophorhabdus sp. PtaU1.Bin050]
MSTIDTRCHRAQNNEDEVDGGPTLVLADYGCVSDRESENRWSARQETCICKIVTGEQEELFAVAPSSTLGADPAVDAGYAGLL